MALHSTRIRWAAPLALLLALGALVPRPATAAVPAPAATADAVSTSGGCVREAVAFATAVNEYVDAWGEYQEAQESGNGSGMLAAANKIDKAAMAVATTGILLTACLIQLL